MIIICWEEFSGVERGGWGGGVVEAMWLFLRRELECHLIVLWQNNEAGERYCELLLLEYEVGLLF